MTDFTKKLFDSLATKPRIVFPEGENQVIVKAAQSVEGYIEPILLSGADALTRATQMVADGAADSMVAGIDFTSRDVILATRDFIGMTGKTFSASFVMELPNGQIYVLADCAATKNPSAEQLADIAMQTATETYAKVFDDEPRIAMLSFSSFGSGGRDLSMDKIHEAIEIMKKMQPGLLVDGEMQLDTAVNPTIGRKKAPSSKVAGSANVLICPDLNTGNILYKSMEQFAGAHAYGPILQGFKAPVSDLSRGSTLDDVVGAIAITAARLV